MQAPPRHGQALHQPAAPPGRGGPAGFAVPRPGGKLHHYGIQRHKHQHSGAPGGVLARHPKPQAAVNIFIARRIAQQQGGQHDPLRIFGCRKWKGLACSLFFIKFHWVVSLYQGQHRTIPALRLKHRSGSCGTASALPKCSIMPGCGTRIVLRGQKPLALCDRCPCFGSLFPPLAALTFAASSIICTFGLASAAPRSPYRHLELCGIALTLFNIITGQRQSIIKMNAGTPAEI